MLPIFKYFAVTGSALLVLLFISDAYLRDGESEARFDGSLYESATYVPRLEESPATAEVRFTRDVTPADRVKDVFAWRLGELARRRTEPSRIERRYLILARHCFSRSSSVRTCDSMALCNATVPLLNNSPEDFLSKFSFQSRMACLTSLWACDVALMYVCMQVSADEHVWHS
jgi:hypothetical protein